ncbi:MAG: COX15/CtaA family protein [Pseudomonadota bacterium]
MASIPTNGSNTPLTEARHDVREARAVDGPIVSFWLFTLFVLIAGMVLVGGATRLTDSGLSITEWAPVTGTLPPIGQAAWLAEFEKYKAIPEYTFVNAGMTLGEFKTIYWWEWGHRLYGRVIGLAVLLPLVAFILLRMISRRMAIRLAVLFSLVVAQGALGWWMVSSGLTDRVDVSQYRLAAHLGMAVVLLGYTLWLGLDMIGTRRHAPLPQLCLAIGVCFFVYTQMILGAFVAGLRAGKTYTTWPLMDGGLVPRGYFGDPARVADLFESSAAVQFNHRMVAYALCLAVALFWWSVRRTDIRRHADVLVAAVFFQAFIGVLTVLNGTPIALGLAHQAGSLVLFSAALFTVYGCVGEISIVKASSASVIGRRGSTWPPSSKPSRSATALNGIKFTPETPSTVEDKAIAPSR